MGLKILRTYCEGGGKAQPGLREIAPHMEAKRLAALCRAMPLLGEIVKEPDDKKKLEKLETLKKRLAEAGAFLHPATFHICLGIAANPLSVAGVPFSLYYSILQNHESVAGTFSPNGETGPKAILSLSSATSFLSSFAAYASPEMAEFILRTSPLEKYRIITSKKAGAVFSGSREDTALMFLETGLLASEIAKRFPDATTENYRILIDAILNNYAVHESAHVLNHSQGIIASHGAAREELRATLTEFAFGSPGLTLFFLPKKADPKNPNSSAGRMFVDGLRKRCGLDGILALDNDMLSAIAMEMLDEEFVKSFGKHHEEVIPAGELERVRSHLFLGKGHEPLLESIRGLPEDGDGKEEKKIVKKAA